MGQQSTRSLLVLVLAPQLVYLALGSTFLLLGMAALLLPRPTLTLTPAIPNPLHASPLVRQRDLAKSPAEIYRRQKLQLTRIGFFACFYTIVMICSTCTIFYEWWGRDSWLRAPEPSSAPRAPSRPILQFFIVRFVVTLGGGAIAAAWIWWPNATNVWRRLASCKQPPHKCHPHALPVIQHCYSGTARPTSASSHHQIHHLSHFAPPPQQHILHQHQIVKNPQISHSRCSSHKKHRKHRKHYHSGSETQV